MRVGSTTKCRQISGWCVRGPACVRAGLPRQSPGADAGPAAPKGATRRRLDLVRLAGLKGYTTNLAACPDGALVTAEFVTEALWGQG